MVCIFTIHRPLLAIKKENGTIYKGVFYDTYICDEYSIPQIKAKGIKFTCQTNSQEDKETSNNKDFDFYLSKEENHDDIKFHDYLTFNDRKYYLEANIQEFYVIDGEKMILKSYLTNFNHTLDNPSIDKITDKLSEKEILKDGGTTIYKFKDKDITIVECKTV